MFSDKLLGCSFIRFTGIDSKTQWKFKNDLAVSWTIERARGQIKHYTSETLMQRVNLSYTYGTKEFCNRDKKKLPCFLLGVVERSLLSNHLHLPGILQKTVWWLKFSRKMQKCCLILWQRTKPKINSFTLVYSTTLEKEWTKLLKFSMKTLSYAENLRNCTK